MIAALAFLVITGSVHIVSSRKFTRTLAKHLRTVPGT
jgi:hypothetical protein